MDLTELTQYINQLISNLGEVGDKSYRGLKEVQDQIYLLRESLNTTNTLLIILIVLYAINLIFKYFKKK
ncbi:hypothetical protein [Paenibacillus sp. GCM10012306]|uniref:hypothetical protein n=1 Tax=Paenibacillus sp. GCM10012306 TaxID=3317342 RepID=UPI003606F8DA